jgi:uncharacterized protein YgbK (DUF1537 family)
MIAVIADDFTGAAEIAGIGLRYGLHVEVSMSVVMNPKVDLLIVCTDSRSLNKKDAEQVTARTVKEILNLKPGLIYKKIDSVFRGYVLDEIKTQMQVSGFNKALIIGGNPSLGRTIKDGRYFINEKLISETGFASDPEFAITESSVLKMLKATDEIQVLKHIDSLPDSGIIIGEVATQEDLSAWTKTPDDDWVVAGAADFFTALLDKKYDVKQHEEAEIKLPHLYISGTSFDKRKEFIKEVKSKLNCVSYLPQSVMQDEKEIGEEWFNKVSKILQSQKRVIVAIDKIDTISALSLRTIMAKAASRIIKTENINEIFIEGGSTAAAILDELKIKTLHPVNELSRGVVRMKSGDLYITVKPGSYELPLLIEKLYSKMGN